MPFAPRIQYRFSENCASTLPGCTWTRTISLALRFAQGATVSETARERTEKTAHPARSGAHARKTLIPPEKMAVNSFALARRETVISTARRTATGDVRRKMFGELYR